MAEDCEKRVRFLKRRIRHLVKVIEEKDAQLVAIKAEAFDQHASILKAMFLLSDELAKRTGADK